MSQGGDGWRFKEKAHFLSSAVAVLVQSHSEDVVRGVGTGRACVSRFRAAHHRDLAGAGIGSVRSGGSRRAGHGNQPRERSTEINQDKANSDLEVRHKFAMSLTYQVPNVQTENRFVRGLANGFQLSSVFLLQTGQPISVQSAVDANGKGDTDLSGVGNSGSDAAAACEATSGTASGDAVGHTYIGSVGVANNPGTTNGCANNSLDALGFDPAIGYTPINPHAKYIVAGPGVRANLGRNTFISPGFNTWNVSPAKTLHFTERNYLQARVDVFNILNHPSYALSNGNVFNAAGTTTATTTQGYALPFDPNFLHPSAFFSGGIRSMTLGLKLVF
jgi:hypothetical protein